MSILDQLRRITCVSEFEDQEIDDALLSRIVEGASWAPSAAEAQPWEVIAVRDPQRKREIVGILLDSHLRPRFGGDERRDWLSESPAVLVVCLDRMRAKARYGEIGEVLFGIQDTGAAIQNMRLVALELGVKSCLIREFDHRQMARLLALPKHVEPLIMVALGYSQVRAERKPGLPLEDNLHQEQW